jgi:Methyltransferase domain
LRVEPVRLRTLVSEWMGYERTTVIKHQSLRARLFGIGGVVDAGLDGLMLLRWAGAGLVRKDVPLTADRFELLRRAVRAVTVRGLWLEFGVAGGQSINLIADLTEAEVVGLDTFEGLPSRWSPRCGAGSFSRNGAVPPVRPNVTIRKGQFADTLPGLLASRPGASAAFVHIDCDLYSSTVTVLEGIGPRLVPGSVLVFDEFCRWLPDDEERAWREFCRNRLVRFRWVGCSLTGSVAVVVTQVGSGVPTPLTDRP